MKLPILSAVSFVALFSSAITHAQAYNFDFSAYGGPGTTFGTAGNPYVATDSLGSGIVATMSHSVSSTDFDYTWMIANAAGLPASILGNLAPSSGYSGVLVPNLDVGTVLYQNKITTVITFSTPIDIVLDFGDIDNLDRFGLSVSGGSFVADKLWAPADILISDTGPTTSALFTAGNYQYDGVFPDDLQGAGSLYEGVRVTFSGVSEITAVWDSGAVGSTEEGGPILFPAAVPEPSVAILSFGMIFGLWKRRRS